MTQPIPGSAQPLKRAGAGAAIAMIGLIPLQVAVFALDPPPDTAVAWLELFAESPLRGILAMDILYLLNNVLLGIFLIALYLEFRSQHQPLALTGLLTGMVSIATYFPTNKAFELWQLADAYRSAESSGRDQIVAAAQSQLSEYTGTAFAMYYILGGVCILLFAAIVVRSGVWGKAAAATSLSAGVLMLVPSTAGTLGMICAMLSLIPWVWFCAIAARRLWRADRFTTTEPSTTPCRS